MRGLVLSPNYGYYYAGEPPSIFKLNFLIFVANMKEVKLCV